MCQFHSESQIKLSSYINIESHRHPILIYSLNCGMPPRGYMKCIKIEMCEKQINVLNLFFKFFVIFSTVRIFFPKCWNPESHLRKFYYKSTQIVNIKNKLKIQ